MALNPLSDVTWDSATGASIHFGSTKVALTKLSTPKVEVKISKIGAVGSGIANKRTPGKAEVADFGAELLATDYVAHVMPRMPKMGGTMVQFQTLVHLLHPSIAGSLSILLDRCRIVAVEGPELDGSEKELIYKLTISCMNRHDRGANGTWKSLAWDTLRPSADARAMMKF
jgi:hypothetical protein